jgi:hypothetical protein
MVEYKMLRVREEDYDKLREAQRLLQQKGLDSIDWKALRSQKYVAPPTKDLGGDAAALALTLGFVIGVGAAAVAALVASSLKTEDDEDDDE